MITLPEEMTLSLPQDRQQARAILAAAQKLQRSLEDEARQFDSATSVGAQIDNRCQQAVLRDLAGRGIARYRATLTDCYNRLKQDWAGGSFVFSPNYRMNQMLTVDQFEARFRKNWQMVSKGLAGVAGK